MPNISEEKALSQNGLLYLWQQLKTMFTGKVDKVEGKGLSTNDYTTEEKNKLEGIAAGANKTTVEDVLTSTSTTNALSANQGKILDDKIKALGDNMGELGYGDMMKAVYDSDNDGVVDNAKKLDGKAVSDFALSDGTNITTAFTTASTRTNITSGETLNVILGKIAKFFTDLKTVAFTGSYNDLTNKPTIPTVTNDLTNELKANYDAAYTHSQSAHAPSNAQANVIETIKVNGVTQSPTSKAVDISVPTTVSALSDASEYAKKSDLSTVYEYKGSVASESALPSNAEVGDTYNLEDTGMNVAWNGTAWDPLGSIFTISYISNAEIDEILAS